MPEGMGEIPEELDLHMETYIDDKRFEWNLRQVQLLHSFYLKEAIPLPKDFSLGMLNTIYYKSGARKPSDAEWHLLELKTQDLIGALSSGLRRKFYNSQVPSWVSQLSVVFLLVAIASLLGAVYMTVGRNSTALSQLPLYIVWLGSLGALGSIAFVGFNAISISSDVTFDMNNSKLIALRICLGALFAFVLTLPFGFPGFRGFVELLARNKAAEPGQIAESIPSDAVATASLLLLPLLLGYSSSLVIAIISRFVSAVKAFFGIQDEQDRRNSESL